MASLRCLSGSNCFVIVTSKCYVIQKSQKVIDFNNARIVYPGTVYPQTTCSMYVQNGQDALATVFLIVVQGKENLGDKISCWSLVK